MCKSLIVAMLCLAFAFASIAQVAARTGIGGNVPLTKRNKSLLSAVTKVIARNRVA